jgi:hypothetical protein
MRFDNCHHPFRWRVPRISRFDHAEFHSSEDLQRLFDHHDRVVVDFSADPVDRELDTEFRDLIQRLGIYDRVRILTGDWSLRGHDPHTVYWPVMLDLMRHHHQAHVRPVIDQREFRLGCVNGMPRAHRFFTLHLLEQHALDQDSVIVCHGLRHLYTGQYLSWNHLWFENLPQAVLQRLQQDAYQRGVPGASTWDQDQHGITHPAFQRCYLNLVTESDMGHSVYVSEKIFKPLMAGQLWITVGPQHATQPLRWLGFECFDDVMHQHDYEQCSDWLLRTELAVDLLRRIWNDIPDIYHHHRLALEHNQRHAHSQQLQDLLRWDLRQHDLIEEPV